MKVGFSATIAKNILKVPSPFRRHFIKQKYHRKCYYRTFYKEYLQLENKKNGFLIPTMS